MDNEFDIVILGAGPAGISAAVTAGRLGNNVCLIEKNERIGGVLSSCMGMMLGAGYPCKKTIGGFFEDLVSKLYSMNPPAAQKSDCSLVEFGEEVIYDPEILMSTLYNMLKESGVNLYTNIITTGIELEDNEIKSIEITDGNRDYIIKGKMFIDCTGNGDLAVMAGVPYIKGNSKGLMMGTSMTFFMEGVDWDKAFADKSDPYFTKYAKKGIEEGRIHKSIPQIYILKGFHQGSVYFNTVTVTGVDGTDPQSVKDGAIEGRRRAIELGLFCQQELPGFENARINTVGTSLGIRETRHLEGQYCLKYEDIAKASKFYDGIVACDNPLDEVFRDENTNVYSHEKALVKGEYYTIPLRCLIPKTVKNLLFAGKNISVDEKAFASVRGMPQCMLMGQAASVAAGESIMSNNSVQDVNIDKVLDVLSFMGVCGINGHDL